MYLDISYTVPGKINSNSVRYIDANTVEVLFLNEVVDNPSHTLSKYYHHWVPLLGKLPAAFSSKATVLDCGDIVSLLLAEYAAHSEMDEYLVQAFPRGLDVHIGNVLESVIDYLLYENDVIFGSYTSVLIRSVYWPNVPFGYWQSWNIRESSLKRCGRSSIHSASMCVKKLEEVFLALSHVVDINESMKLPLRISSKLFSFMTVLFSIPIESDENLSPLVEYMTSSPNVLAIEKWCKRTNEGCRIWSTTSLDRSRRSKPKARNPWWEWIGWSGRREAPSHPHEESTFVANKSHNILFAMICVGCTFAFIASQRR